LRGLKVKKPENKLLLVDRKSELAKFRSSSAPPEMDSEFEPTTPLNNEKDLFRTDPAYYQFYYSQRLLNPRLPPPIVTDWSTSVNEYDEDGDYASTPVDNKPSWNNNDMQKKKSSVVDRIQEDFPRTPSPVYRENQKRISAAPGNAFLFGQESDDAVYPSQSSFQANQQLTPMFFPGTSSDDVLSQQMNNLNIGGDKKLKRQQNNIPVQQNYYQLNQQQPQQQQQQFKSPPQHAQQQFSPQQSFQSIQPQVPQMVMQTGNPYPFYPQNIPYSQNMNYPPQFANSNQMNMMGMNRPVPQAQPQAQYNQYYNQQQPQPVWGAQQQKQPLQAPQAVPPQTTSTAPNDRRNGRQNNNAKQPKVETPDYNNVPRSKLMEEFKSGRGRKFELKDIVGSVVEFSRDQHGSRFIQQKLETASGDEKDMIFKEVQPHALKLMTDVFGNYVIQKFFEHGLPSHKKALARALKGNVLNLTLQTYGCRVIQKALEVIEDEDKRELSYELNGHVMKCIQDQNGNHVIQKCIEKVPPLMCQFIVDSFVGNIVSQAVHAYGCRVIQRILEYCSEEQTQVVLNEILVNVMKLVKDQYGNYVVQHVLEHGQQKHKASIVKAIKGNILQLSYNKYASNVIEKCYQYGGKKERIDIIEEICGKYTGKDMNNSPLFEMMKDKYANYVIQKIIELSDDSQRRMLLDVMKPHLASIRRLTFGKHIIAVIEKYYPGL
jgi:hypothetical protein